MAFTMTIGGVDVIPYLDLASLQIEVPLNARATLTARLEDESSPFYRPVQFEEVVVTQDGTTIFGGFVLDADEEDFAGDLGVATVITAVDHSARLDRVYITLTTAAGQTVRQVVDAILAAGNVSSEFGITRDGGMAAGSALQEQTFTDATVTAALDHVSQLSGWYRRVTPDKVLVMAAIGTESAPAGITDPTTGLILGSARRQLGEYGNRQKVRIGTGTQAQDHTFLGDASSRVFTLPFATAQRPAQVYDISAAAYRPVGIHGVDTLFEWTYRVSDNAIVQLTEAPPGTPHDPPSVGENFTTVGWIAQFPYTVTGQSSSEIAARKLWERPPVDAPDIFTKATGQELADALIRRYAVWPPPRTVDVVVWTAGFAPGQVAALTSTTRNLSGDWLITAMQVSVQNEVFLRYRLSLLEGSEQQASFREFWRGLSGSGGGGSTITGGILPEAPTPVIAIYASSLGGSALVDVTHSTWAAVPNFVDWVCPVAGAYRCRVDVWTLDAGTSVTPRLYDVTAAAAAVTGTASTSTTRAEQVLSFTAVAGHRYRLQVLPGNTNAGVLGIGGIEA